jgi:UDPglucose 6-dehydrogenase
MRESPAVALIEGLLSKGARVTAHDPKAMPNARQIFGDRISFAGDPYAAVDGADALVIVTEWLQYRTPDFDRIKDLLRTPLIIDGRNLYDPQRMRRYGFIYRCVGRAAT